MSLSGLWHQQGLRDSPHICAQLQWRRSGDNSERSSTSFARMQSYGPALRVLTPETSHEGLPFGSEDDIAHVEISQWIVIAYSGRSASPFAEAGFARATTRRSHSIVRPLSAPASLVPGLSHVLQDGIAKVRACGDLYVKRSGCMTFHMSVSRRHAFYPQARCPEGRH